MPTITLPTELPVLETTRLVLRALHDDDVPAVFEALSDPHVMRWTGREPHADHAVTRAWIEVGHAALAAGEGLRWALVRRGEDRVVGTCGIWRIMREHVRAEVGYDLARSAWGQGLMTEALAAVATYAFDALHLHSLEAQTDPENVASQGVLRRLGFTLDGRIRQNYRYRDGRFGDTALYTLVTGELRRPEPR